jgi:molecular chaperone GrpE
LMEDVDTHKSGEISEVLQKGYMLNKKVIRPAMVKVAQ